MKNRPLGALYNYANGQRRRCAHARARTHHPVNTLIKLILPSSVAQTPFGEAPPRQPEPVWALQIDCQEFHRAAARWREVGRVNRSEGRQRATISSYPPRGVNRNPGTCPCLTTNRGDTMTQHVRPLLLCKLETQCSRSKVL